MTALSEYQRLECPGLWRDTPGSQRREVMVAFGDATLVIREMPSERALTHWSLPAAVRVNPGRMPAVFSPGHDSGEELEIDDETMIAAITKVHAIIAARRPRPGRLRGALVWSAAAAIAAVALLWLPGALIGHTAKVLPAATRQDIGLAILADLQRLTGRPCAAPDGVQALAEMGRKLLGGRSTILVLPEGLDGALHLPGNLIVIGRKLVEDQDGPETAAGFILAEQMRAQAHDPVPAALRHAGLRATFHLLTTGDVPVEAFRGYGERLLAGSPDPVPAGALLDRFRQAGVASADYARAAGLAESQPELISADPFAAAPALEPVLDDTDWVAAQGICAG